MMEEDGRYEAQGTVQANAEVESPFLEHEYIKGNMSAQLKCEYRLSKGRIEWKDQADEYLHEILTDKARKKFLKVPTSDIQYLCYKNLGASWLPGMLVDAAMFFRLHRTWAAYICPTPECHCWFADENSLILHLIREHHYSWPFIQHNPTEEDQLIEALRSAAWTPIDVEAAMGVAAQLGDDTLGTFEWPLSEDSARRNLLNELQNRLGVLLHSQQPVPYNDFLRALIAVAFDNILRHLDSSNRMSLPFRNLLCRSPICFRFMDEESLSFFVECVKNVQDFLQDKAFQSREQDMGIDSGVNWTRGEHLEAVSIPDGSDCFVLDGDKIKQCCENGEGIGAWIVRAPIFPMIKKVPLGASSILQLAKSIGASVSKHLRTICMQPDFKSAGLTSCFKLWNVGNWPMPLFGTMPSDLALETEAGPATVDCMLSFSCHSVTEPPKRRKITHDPKMMRYHLELIKLTCELQLLEGQVRGLCAVDLRMYILPLLRSSLRMKLFMFMRRGYGYESGDTEEEDADTDLVTEGSQEHLVEETVGSTVKGEPATAEGSNLTTLCTSKKVNESSRTPLKYGSGGSSTDGTSDIDCMAIDGGESLSEELPAASVVAGIDSRPSPVTIADAAPSGGRNSSGAAIAETETQPDDASKSDAKSELKAKPESQQLEEDRWNILNHFETFSDTDSQPESQDESDEGDERLEDPNLCTEEDRPWNFIDEVHLQTKGTKGTKDTVIFLRMTIADIVKHCLERSSFDAAKNVWEWRTIRTGECWRCFDCKMMFPDEKSHMAHMVSRHQLGLSWDHFHLVPSQVWQGLTGLNKDVKERTLSLDDSITVDYTYRRCLVNMAKPRIEYENDENSADDKFLRFNNRVQEIQDQLRCLKHLFDRKDKQCYTSDAMAEVDTEIVQYFARLKKLKQGLFDLCFYDCKKDILPHINSFLQNSNLMGDDGLWSWACKRLNDLLCSVRCPYLPGSVFRINLESSGKVIIKINHDNCEVRFAYFGLSWKFDGNIASKETEIKGSFSYSAHSLSLGFNFWRKVELDNCEKKSKLSLVKLFIAWGFQSSLEKKLLQFQDEFCKKTSRFLPK